MADICVLNFPTPPGYTYALSGIALSLPVTLPSLICTGAGALSFSPLSITGAVFTGGTGTTTFPQIYVNEGTAPTTWSTSGTILGINGPSGFNGAFFDCHVNGGTSVFSVDRAGNLACSAQATCVNLTSSGTQNFGNSRLTISSGVVTKYGNVTTVSNGVPAELATVDLTGQVAAISATTLYAVPAAGVGLYRVSVYAKVTTAGGVSSVLGGTNGFQLTWTDPTDSAVPTVTIVDLSSAALNANTTTTVYLGSAVIAAKASTNIQYAFDYTSAGSAMAYKISIKLEYLG